jgi:hypothetical protein
MNSRYMLDGRDSELKPHVGHRVEVTGTLDSSASGSGSGSTAGGSTAGTSSTGSTSGTTGSGTTGSGTTASGSSGSGMTGSGHGDMQMGGARLRVTSVKMISSDCSSAK